MTVYYIVLAGFALLGYLLRLGGVSRKKDAAFLICAFVILASLSAFRYDVGIDYSYIYSPAYEKVLADPVGFSFADTRFEPGFVLLEKGIAFLFQNYQMLFIVTSYLIIGLFMIAYWKLSPDIVLSVLLFLLLSEYYCSMNFLRQTLAGVIALFAIPYIKKRRFVPFLLLVLLAACFHKSALILIPVFFLCMIPFNKIVLTGYTVLTILIYFNTERIMAFVTQYVYKGYTAQSIHFQVAFEWPFAIAMLLEFLIVLVGARKLLQDDPDNKVYLHYAFYAFFFTLMGTRHSIIDRLSLYFELAFPLSIPLVYRLFRQEFSAWKPALKSPGKRPRHTAVITAGLLIVIFGGGLTIHQYALMEDHHGVVPYKMIINQPFYETYLEELRMPVLETNPALEQPVDMPVNSQTESPLPKPAASPPVLPKDTADTAPLELPMEDYLALDGGT